MYRVECLWASNNHLKPATLRHNVPQRTRDSNCCPSMRRAPSFSPCSCDIFVRQSLWITL